MANPLARMMQIFVNALPENATRTAKDDPGLTIKTSPLLWPYEIFVLEWERRTLLRDLDLMVKRDARVDRANYVFGNAATRGGITVSVDSGRTKAIQKRAQDVLDKLMKETKINAHLPAWSRTILRDGDIFLNVIAEMDPDGYTARIVRIKNLPAISMERLDDMTDSFPEIRRAFLQIDPITRQEIQAFPLWSVNHIRWKYEPGERYGRSQYYSGRAAWKKLQMTEEDLVVRRRTRAVQRRVHVVGDKDHPGTETEVNKYKALNRLDDPNNAKVTTDYFINGLGDVRNLEGDAHLDHIKDVEYLLENVMIGTGVPLHILGFGRNVNRDIVNDQRKTYKEDVEGLQDLLENGDPGPFSGLRSIFNMALALQRINPEDVSINIRWTQLDVMAFPELVTAVNELRASQPVPMVSRRTGMKMLGRGMDLMDDNAVDAELKAIDQELQADKDAEAALATTVNPMKPTTTNINRSTYSAQGRPQLDSLKQANPLRSDKMAELENRTADDVRGSFAAVAARLTSEAFVKNIAHLTGQTAGKEDIQRWTTQQADVQLDATIADVARVDEEILRAYVLHKFDAAWEAEETNFVNTLLTSYREAAGMAADTVHKDVRVSIDFHLVSQSVLDTLEVQAGYRVRGLQQTTRNQLAQAIADAYQANDNLDGYMSRIQDVVTAPAWRRSMIARTEMAYAFNMSNLKYQMLAGYNTFRWEAVMDNRTCQRCAERNGQTFTVTDTNPPPLHPNCRCIMVPIR
ncbi:portal protein [Alicyclobacillus tolerans]|uniref:portal protein n=1 Tax=Alicyclobacillus tolerans TaxID=90970 RepID=UPI001F3FA658|nr:portal protein [Alicyclobacillus tolerans]MCF8566903.1 portal protein [Alicyclobacillus tolerans]